MQLLRRRTVPLADEMNRLIPIGAAVAATVFTACGGDGSSNGASVPCGVDERRLSAVLATETPFPFGDDNLLQLAFTDPVEDAWLLEGAATSVADIRAFNDSVFMLAEGFENCYECLVIEGATSMTGGNGQQAVQVSFSYQGRRFNGLAYGRLPQRCSGVGAAALVIPGSGHNQSTAIVNRDPTNVHHGILDALAAVPNIFTLVKPNEDALAWHNGRGGKVTGSMIWNYHINRGGSYSVSYLAQSLAFTKWMKGCFGTTIVAGLSQGGAATMLNALQSKPTAAIVSAGHSLLFDQVEYSGPNQLVNVPGYSRLAKAGPLVQALGSGSTRWLFTWGRADGDIYGLEAETGFTASYIEPLPNVEVAIHDGGHVVPVPEVARFLDGIVDP